jgi:hypothetical protein
LILVWWSLFAALLAPGSWRAIPADGVEMHLTQTGSRVRIDFDFHGHGGYAIARREVPLELPENFEFTFRIRGEAPRNTLEFKLIDPTGENVWWTTNREFDFPREWKRLSIRKSQLQFAWGPLGGGEVPRRIGALEIVVTAGTGGRGTIWIDDLELSPIESTSELPPPFGPFHRQVVTLDLKTIVGSLIRLGQKDRALQLMRRLFRDQRPPGWNGWAEAVRADYRKPGFIGDMPHTWVGSDFIRSVLDLFAYENDDGALVIGAGIDEAWLSTGVTIDDLSTHYGRLGYTMRRSGDEVTIDFRKTPSPPGGIVIRSPIARPIRSVTADDQPAAADHQQVRLRALPRRLVIRY